MAARRVFVAMGVVNALTVDVEDYYHVQAFADVIPRSQWDGYPKRVERNTYQLLEMFLLRKVRGTFFLLGWVARRCPKLAVDVLQAGHRIGCHGYMHRAIGDCDHVEFREDVRMAKQAIEDATGVAVKSYRAPSFSINARTMWALEILGEEGFDYDSSIFPIFHDHYGIPNAPRFPYCKTLSSGHQIKEFPPSTIRFAGVNLPVAGGGYLRLLPYSVTSWAIRQLNTRENQPAMVYLHPWEIDPGQPRISAPWLSRFRHYQNLDSTEAKCVKLLEEFSWGPMEEVITQTLCH